MENVWNIRKNEELYYILPEKKMLTSGIDHADVAVIAYLYYKDTLEQHLTYLSRISDEMAIYLISSNEDVLKLLVLFAQNKANVKVIKKINRGRDVSALLISSREIFQKYKYVCFVHDKSAKSESEQEKVQFWVENLWGNTLKSEGYIENVLKLFVDNPDLGLLVPPEPYTYMRQIYFWHIEYERTKALAAELELVNTNIDRKYPPITLGTVFWCKSSIMKKLFAKHWKFEDFIEEPMPIEGTISHAVERIFAFLAQDAGSKTATIMCETYAKKLILALQNERKEIYEILNTGIGLNNILILKEFFVKRRQIKEYTIAHHKVYLFGAGKIGKDYLIALREIIGCSPNAFLVTNTEKNEKHIKGVPVISSNLIQLDNSIGIIISVGVRFENEIKAYLISRNYEDYLCVNDLLEDDVVLVGEKSTLHFK